MLGALRRTWWIYFTDYGVCSARFTSLHFTGPRELAARSTNALWTKATKNRLPDVFLSPRL